MKAKLTVSALLAICPLTFVNAQSTDVTSEQSSASAQSTMTESQLPESEAHNDAAQSEVEAEMQKEPQDTDSSAELAATEAETPATALAQADEALDQTEANITEVAEMASTTAENDTPAIETQLAFEESYQDSSTDFDPESLDSEETFNPNAYNFIRPIPEEGDVFIPVLSDAKVFAEFIDELPAVVNFFTMASEDEIIAFYSDNYGEPVEQERKRGRLNVTYYLEDISTRIVISEQDNRRQVDVLQENAAL